MKLKAIRSGVVKGLGTLTILTTLSTYSLQASAIDCGQNHCTINLSSALQLQTSLDGIQTIGHAGRMEINGDVTFIAADMTLPLGDTDLVLDIDPVTGQLLEFYGTARLPIDEWQLLEDANINAEPPMAVVGLFQQETINDIFQNQLPLNDGTALNGTTRESTSPYLLFHTSTGGLSLDLNQMFNLGMSDNSSFAINIAEEKSISFALDLADPYLFSGQDYKLTLNQNGQEPSKIEPEKSYLAVRYTNEDPQTGVQSEQIEYYDDNGQLVQRFIHDQETGALIKHDIDESGSVTVSFYQRDEDGDFLREGATKDAGDYFNLVELNNGVDVNNTNRNRLNGYNSTSYFEKNSDGTISREITEYYDFQGNVVNKFILDPASGRMIKHDYKEDGTLIVSFYQQDNAGDFVLDGDPKENGNYFSKDELAQGIDVGDVNRKRETTSDPQNSNDAGDTKKRRKFDLGLDAFAFSWNGWIPYKAENVMGVPEDSREFSGQLYMKGAITMDGIMVLDGEVVTYIGDEGFVMGGNGDLAISLPSDIVDLSLYLGSASSSFQVSPGKQMAFISGLMEPDTALMKNFMPVAPSGKVTAVGYIDNDFVDTKIALNGEFSLGAELIGQLIGVPLNDLQSIQASVALSPQGFELQGVTRNQIHPDIAFGGDIEVEAKVSFVDARDFKLKLAGSADVFGVGLDEVSIEINAGGMFINGIFVTPLNEIAMLGSVTNKGPALTGYATISLGLGEITQAMQDAAEALTSAQNEVNRLSSEIARLRNVVQAERDLHSKKLSEATASLTAAQSQVNKLNGSIASHNRAIASHKSKIAAKYRWYKKAKWYQKASRYASYIKEKTWRSADIARRYASIGVLKASLAVANIALDAAKLSLKGLQALTVVTPIDLDPRVAAVITAKEVANASLEVLKAPFANVPLIKHDFEGRIEATLDISGLSGMVTAEFDGYEALRGSLEFKPVPKACITIPTMGEACSNI